MPPVVVTVLHTLVSSSTFRWALVHGKLDVGNSRGDRDRIVGDNPNPSPALPRMSPSTASAPQIVGGSVPTAHVPLRRASRCLTL